MESVSLIDVSSEDDLLISSSSQGFPDLLSSGLAANHDEHNNFRLEAAIAQEAENRVKLSKQLEQAPELSESPEQKHAKSGKFYLRKSLAWDSAFFTSEGVLNPEELAIVNSTFRKAETCTLPGIQEDLRKSTESTSTLDSDSYALENFEVDLFENLRASIQKSLSKCDKASSGEPDAPCLGSLKKVELPSQNKMKLPVALKRDGVSKQRLECTSKEAIIGVKAAAKGSGSSKSLLKPPRIVPKPTLLPTVASSKASSGSIQIKNNTRRASSGNGANRQPIVAFNKTNGDSCSMTSKSIPSPRPTPGSHPGSVVFSTAFCSSHSSPLSSSSHSADKSTLEPMRKRSASRNSDHSLSGSTTKTPLRTSKSKLGPSNTSHPPTCANSTFKFSSRVSPNSSIDSVVSESSSSTSTTIKPSNSMESLDASSASSSPSLAVLSDIDASQPSDMQIFSIDQPCIRKEISGNPSQSQHIAKASLGTRVVSEPSAKDHSRSCISSNSGAKCFKPSGLRMPSPKIGYFDAEKTLVRSSNKISQTCLRNSLLKSTTGINDTVGVNKLKSSKLPSIRPAAQHVTMNFDSSQTQSTPLSHSMRPASPVSMHQLSKPAQLHMDLSPITSEDCHSMDFRAVEVADVVHLKSMATILTGNGSTVSGEGWSNVTHKRTQATYQIGKEEKHEQSTCGLNNQDGHMENDCHSVTKKNEKENLFPNGLNRHLPTESQNMSMVEIMGKISSLSLFETNDFVSGD